MRYQSSGCIRRILNTLTSPFYQGDVNHITGDIHYVALLLCRRKTILTIHDLEIIDRTSGIQRALLLFFWFILPARRVHCITVISDFTRLELLKYVPIPEKRIRVIHDCIPGKLRYSPQPFNTQCPTILQVGTKNNKNIPNLILALKGVPCNLIILGKITAQQQELLQQSNIHYKAVSGLTYEEVVALYLRIDMLAFVSTYEGFGLPILEAQSVGRPVVSSEVASMPEVAGGGAVLVDPYSVATIRQGILAVIQDAQLREEIIRIGLENVKRFQPEVIAGKYAALYREIAGDDK